MADAVPQCMPLVSLEVSYPAAAKPSTTGALSSELHLLGASEFIGNSLRLVGMLAGLFGVCFAA